MLTLPDRQEADDQRSFLQLTQYESQTAVLSTMHGKEAAIAPALRDGLGIEVIVPDSIDTDALGTFTGEIARHGSMLDAAIAKARLGMQTTGMKLALASEGSYGPHPAVPFIPLGLELLVFVDDDRELIISETMACDVMNFRHVVADREADISDFLTRVGFPEHGLVVQPNKPWNAQPGPFRALRHGISRWAGGRANPLSASGLRKGVRNYNDLDSAVREAASWSQDGQAMIQTDMRAHHNPTRLLALEELAKRLVKRIATLCPECGSPGFGQTDQEDGLPCEACAMPTSQVNKEVFSCPACEYNEKRKRADGKLACEQIMCPHCNP